MRTRPLTKTVGVYVTLFSKFLFTRRSFVIRELVHLSPPIDIVYRTFDPQKVLSKFNLTSNRHMYTFAPQSSKLRCTACPPILSFIKRSRQTTKLGRKPESELLYSTSIYLLTFTWPSVTTNRCFQSVSFKLAGV